MSRFELVVWDDECDKVTFYSVKQEDARLTEADKFFEKFSELSEYSESAQQLLTLLLKSIGNDYGAMDVFFNRREDEVDGLPPHGRFAVQGIDFHYPQFPLRLYALRPNI